jgi:exonuclease SbcC
VALPARLLELRGERDAAQRVADGVESLERDRDRAQVRRDAAVEVVRLTGAMTEAERALVAASSALASAQASLTRLRQRRLDGMAGELATSLLPDQPCPVCGSTEHPAPAVHADPASADDVRAAEEERDGLALAERAASERVAAVRAERAAAAALADSRTEEQAELEWAAVSAALDAALAASGRSAELDARITELSERAEHLTQEAAASAAALGAAREVLVLAEQRLRDAEALVAEARGPFATVAERLDVTATEVTAARELSAALAEHTRRSAVLDQATAERGAALEASVFDDATAVQQALRSVAEQDALDVKIAAHAVQREKEREILLDLELRTLPEEPIDLTPAEQASVAARAIWKAAVDDAVRATGTAERLAELIDSAASEHARSSDQAADHEALKSLSDTIAGRGANTHRMTLETFVLAAELEEIVAAANRRLSDMSTGRYQLRHSDALAARGAASGLGIVVYDAFTGQTRPAQSLSGGETFLSSLALALGLAEVVTARAGGIQLDTLFIDEGFGSLDAETLEVAMRTLDELRAGGRTVGVISHVEAMQEQIPAQLLVEQTAEGPSRILS